MKRFLKIVSIIFILIFSSSLFVACDDSSDYVFDVYEEIDTVIIREYKGRKKDVVVPEKINGVTVREIFVFAFAETEVQTIIIPENVNKINSGAFADCSSLKSITFGKELSILGEKVFANCTSLEKLYFNGDAPLESADCYQNTDNLTFYYKKSTNGWDEYKHIDMNYNLVPW